MLNKTFACVLVAAAAGGVLLAWSVTSAPARMPTTLTAEAEAPSNPVPQGVSVIYRLEAPDTTASLDPKRSLLRFKSPYGSIDFDGEAGTAKVELPSANVGMRWWLN